MQRNAVLILTDIYMKKLLLAWSARLSLLLVFCTVAMASFGAAVPTVVNGYDLAGRLVFSKGVPAGHSTIDGLNAGLLVVNGKKVVVE